MSKKHLVFVVNPHSGVDRLKAIQDAVDSTLDKQMFSYELQHTGRPGHGTELAAAAAKAGAYAVVAVGGDGSVNDVMAGLLHTSTALAIIPKGSGNGMARTVQIPLDVVGALQVINKGKINAIDVGFANDRPFISNAGVGFDALISKKFAGNKTRGLLSYTWLVARHLWTYKSWKFKMWIDAEAMEERAFIISIANGQQYGYNFIIAPDARWDDGLLDIVVIRRFPKALGAALVWRAMKGTITDSKYVQHYRGKEISISHPKLKWMQVDGDAHPCGNEVRFRIAPGALQLMVP